MNRRRKRKDEGSGKRAAETEGIRGRKKEGRTRERGRK